MSTFSVFFPLGVQISKAIVIISAWRSGTEHVVCRVVCPWLTIRWEEVLVSGFAVTLLLETAWANGGTVLQSHYCLFCT